GPVLRDAHPLAALPRHPVDERVLAAFEVSGNARSGAGLLPFRAFTGGLSTTRPLAPPQPPPTWAGPGRRVGSAETHTHDFSAPDVSTVSTPTRCRTLCSMPRIDGLSGTTTV